MAVEERGKVDTRGERLDCGDAKGRIGRSVLGRPLGTGNANTKTTQTNQIGNLVFHNKGQKSQI